MKRTTLIVIAVLFFLAVAILGKYNSTGNDATSSILKETKIEQSASIGETQLKV